MIKQSNELVALEWLIDPLNQEFWALHAHITPSPSELLAHFARQYWQRACHGKFTRLYQTCPNHRPNC